MIETVNPSTLGDISTQVRIFPGFFRPPKEPQTDNLFTCFSCCNIWQVHPGQAPNIFQELGSTLATNCMYTVTSSPKIYTSMVFQAQHRTMVFTIAVDTTESEYPYPRYLHFCALINFSLMIYLFTRFYLEAYCGKNKKVDKINGPGKLLTPTRIHSE